MPPYQKTRSENVLHGQYYWNTGRRFPGLQWPFNRIAAMQQPFGHPVLHSIYYIILWNTGKGKLSGDNFGLFLREYRLNPLLYHQIYTARCSFTHQAFLLWFDIDKHHLFRMHNYSDAQRRIAVKTENFLVKVGCNESQMTVASDALFFYSEPPSTLYHEYPAEAAGLPLLSMRPGKPIARPRVLFRWKNLSRKSINGALVDPAWS